MKKLSKIGVFITFVTVLVVLFTFNASAVSETVIDSGECGDNLTWTLYDDGELVIEGTGEMTDWTSYLNVPWYSTRSSITKVTIGNNVTSIGRCAFDYCTSLASITLGNGVTHIGSASFSHCSNLTSVTISNSVTTIGGEAFYYCHNLTNVTMGNSVTTIGYSAFQECYNLAQINIPDSVKIIGSHAFLSCQNITTVDIPDGVTKIGYSAFSGCASLKNVTIGEGVTSIEKETFRSCVSLTAITLPASLTSIGDNAFSNCSSLESATVLSKNAAFGSNIFSNCKNLTLYGYSGSTTETYATANSIPFVALNQEIDNPFTFVGAQIRTSGVQGLRFIFEMDYEAYSLLSESERPKSAQDIGVGFGTVLLPKSYLGDDTLTKETENAVVVPAVKLYTQPTDEIVTYTACLIETPVEKYTEEYVAVPYITYLDNGVEKTIYGEQTQNVTIFNIAEIAYEDENTDAAIKQYLFENILNAVIPGYETDKVITIRKVVGDNNIEKPW